MGLFRNYKNKRVSFHLRLNEGIDLEEVTTLLEKRDINLLDYFERAKILLCNAKVGVYEKEFKGIVRYTRKKIRKTPEGCIEKKPVQIPDYLEGKVNRISLNFQGYRPRS